MIVLHCPKCSIKLTLGDDRAGDVLECPNCDNRIRVPVFAPSPAPTPVPRTPAPPPRSGPTPVPRPVPAQGKRIFVLLEFPGFSETSATENSVIWSIKFAK